MERFVCYIEIKNIIYFISFLLFVCFSSGYAEKSLSYDANGNVVKCIVSNAGEISYSYDPLNRLTGINYQSGESIQYVYDRNDNLIEVCDQQGKTFYSYDPLNRLVSAEFPQDASLSYEYDASNKIIKIIYPGKEEVNYLYDERGRLYQVCDQGVITQYEYDDVTNLVIRERLANGVITDFSYDALSRVSAVSHKRADGLLIVLYQFRYDQNNHCILFEEITDEGTKGIDYTYDSLNRLTAATHSDGAFEKYVYDGAGNCLTKETNLKTVHYVYDQSNRLVRYGDVVCQYDTAGNIVKKSSPEKTINLTYDSSGRLLIWEDGQDKVAFAYDGEGRRISKTVNSKTTFFINDPNTSLSRVLLEQDEAGTTHKRYVYGLSRLFEEGPKGKNFFLYEHPGKGVSFLIGQNQEVLERYSYSPFGVREGEGFHSSSYGYAGEERDEETGLIYLRNRYYDPEVGRFLSPDSMLGILHDPQTLNPYVYVRNNPINYIDPSGLYAIKVPLDLYGNFPGAYTPDGKSFFGHGWVGGKDAAGNSFTQGAWPEKGGRIRTDEDVISLCETTVSMTIWVTPEQQKKALEAGNYAHWRPYDNCIDHVVKSLDAIEYPHPSFKPSPIGISDPALFCNWLIEENKHINPNFILGEGDIVPYEINLLPQATQEQSCLFHANYGGVSFSKTAELMTSISDIAGAIFDQKTGQIILYGKKERSLPRMHLDDLAVAIRSVYGLGEKGEEDPGISLDPDPASSKMKATYYGETQNTRFGQVMLEADELLKQLIIGKDSAGKKLKAHVYGYRNLFDLCKKNNYLPRDLTCRMWFVPEKISLSQSEDGSSMLFDDVRMQVLTESKFQGKERQDPVAEKFATHFTQNYDAYSQEFPVLQDLKRLGKITGVVKWIKEQSIPFDLSFFKNYIPEFIHTPTYVNRIGNFNYGILMSGGVVYHLGSHNFYSVQDNEADHIKQEILAHRSSEEEFAWDLDKDYMAVAQTFAKTLKVGEVRKAFTDMQFPLPGKKFLALTRTYNSFNEDHSGFGIGWAVIPAKLRFPDQATWQRFSDNTIHKVHKQIFVAIEGIEALYILTGLDDEGQPLYETQGRSFSLIQHLDETFTLQRNHTLLHFDPQGKISKIAYPGSVEIDYVYEGQRLIAISYAGKKTIHLEYSGPRIQRIIGPGNKTIEYEYTGVGQLKTVRDQEGVLMSYDYDQDHHLIAIFDATGLKSFEATYDAYHRALEKKGRETHLNQYFSLEEKTARLETTENFFLEEQFDDHFRPKIIQDALGRTLEYHYASDFGPEKRIDHNGLEISYEYDQFGNLKKITDAYRGERRFEFDQQGHLLEETDGKGLTTAYRYDSQGRLTKIYKPFYLTQLTVRNGEVIKEGNERFATTLHYDSSGNLASIEFPNGTRRSFEYDDSGLPLKISFENGCISERKYDERSRLIAICEAGRTLNYTYNERDQITSISSSSGTTRYSGDRLGNILSITDPLGKTTHFEYDEHHHLHQVTDALGAATFYEYSPQGNLIKICLPNGSFREIAYDAFQRPIALK